MGIEQAMKDYKRLGYSDNWINQRLKSIEIRKELTDEWKKHGDEPAEPAIPAHKARRLSKDRRFLEKFKGVGGQI